MKRLLLLGHHDLRLFFREKVSYVWLFVIPLLFVVFLGFAQRGPGNPANPRPPVRVENRDAGPLGAVLVAQLADQGLRLLAPGTDREAEHRLHIPADFTACLQRREPVHVTLSGVAPSSPAVTGLIEARLVRALIAFNAALIEQSVAGTNSLDPAAMRAILDRPPRVTVTARFAGRRPVPVGFQQSLPGNLVMFLLLNGLIFGGTSLAEERRRGVLRRLAVHPLRRWELVGGKIYGRLLLGGAQAIVLLAVGQFALGVPVFREPVGMLLVVGAYAWTCAAFGVLIGATARNPDKIAGLCILTALLLAALGGCWWPLEIVPDGMRLLAYATPSGWAMEALHRLITFGGSASEALLPAAVLAGFGALGSLAAGRWLRY